jgi:hypothetical protein
MFALDFATISVYTLISHNLDNKIEHNLFVKSSDGSGVDRSSKGSNNSKTSPNPKGR